MTATDIDALLTHLELYYSDFAVAHDMDCVRPLVSGWHLDVVNAYAKARRQARNFRRNDPKANNHNRITPEAWERINAYRKVGFSDRTHVRSTTCGSCGEVFAARRADARYCGPRCRQRANRNVTDKSPELGTVDSSATPRHFGIAGPEISRENAPVSVTGQAA